MDPIKPNSDWIGKLRSKDRKLDERTIKIINQFKRHEIYEHKYDENDLFGQLYKDAKDAKRQPNSFMLLRTVLGLVAEKKKIKKTLQDGTNQSKLAGFIWGGANKDEKKKFEELAAKFKVLHKAHFPGYEYKPKPKSPATGNDFNCKTPEDYNQNIFRGYLPTSFGNFPYNNYPSQYLELPYFFGGYPEQSTFDQGLLSNSCFSETIQPQLDLDFDLTNSSLDQNFMLCGQQPVYQPNTLDKTAYYIEEPQYRQTSISANVPQDIFDDCVFSQGILDGSDLS